MKPIIEEDREKSLVMEMPEKKKKKIVLSQSKLNLRFMKCSPSGVEESPRKRLDLNKTGSELALKDERAVIKLAKQNLKSIRKNRVGSDFSNVEEV
jgi:hypothetical protein